MGQMGEKCVYLHSGTARRQIVIAVYVTVQRDAAVSRKSAALGPRGISDILSPIRITRQAGQ